jgi:hypothetical protein
MTDKDVTPDIHVLFYTDMVLCPTDYQENAWILGYKSTAPVTVYVWRVSYPSSVCPESPKEQQ